MPGWFKIVCNQLNTVEGKRKNRQFLFTSESVQLMQLLLKKK